jgi:hypothetical protein
MEDEWTAEGIYPDENWSLSPRDSTDQDAWMRNECARLASRWDDPVAARAAVEDTLSSVFPLAAEAGTLATLVHWPLSVPASSRVRVVLAAGEPYAPKEWRQAGFDIDEYPGAEMGPGLKCLARRDEEIHRVLYHLSTAVYAFTSASRSVLVIVESGERRVFEMTLAQMPLILSNLRVNQSNGEPFVSETVPGITRSDADEWELYSNA